MIAVELLNSRHAFIVGAVYDRALLLKHYKLWVLREIVRGHRPRLQQTQIQSESLPETCAV